MGGNIHTGGPRFIVLRFVVLQRRCVFYKVKAHGNDVSSKTVGAMFPTAFAHLVSLCHILVILAIFQTLHQQKDYNLLKAQMTVSIF